MTTTNELIDEVAAKIRTLIEMAEADARRSRENDDHGQALDDSLRARALHEALSRIQYARKDG